jgi:hypothetical protein
VLALQATVKHEVPTMAATGAVLAASLRKTALGAHSGERSDVRFLFGTEMGSEYQKPSDKV